MSASPITPPLPPGSLDPIKFDDVVKGFAKEKTNEHPDRHHLPLKNLLLRRPRSLRCVQAKPGMR